MIYGIKREKDLSEELENIIKEMNEKGHEELLLQQLIKCYPNIYLSEAYQKLGNCIDAFQDCTSMNLESNFFGQIIKTGEYTSAVDNRLGAIFANEFRSRFVHTIIKYSETLKQLYADLGVLNADQKEAQFWWDSVVNALKEFEFEDLCKVIPNKNIPSDYYFIREKDLRVLLMQKGILEDNYTISYGNLYGERILFARDPVDELFIKKVNEQRQKGLHISRNPKNETGISQQ